MIKGEKYRPLIMKGISHNNVSLIGKVKVNKGIDDVCQCEIQVIKSENVSSFKIGYGGYLFERDCQEDIRKYLNSNQIPYLTNVEHIETLIDKDVVELNTPEGTVRVLFRTDSDDNFIYVTNQCNSNCIFCPDAESIRKSNNGIPVAKLMKIVNLIDENTKNLCITGGEPTLLKDNLFDLLEVCKNRLKDTKFLMITNGRMLYYKKFAEKFFKSAPNDILVAIPIYSHISEVHDMITSVKGSHIQAVTGIKNLIDLGQKIEIRVVVNKINYEHLEELADFFCKQFSNIYRVNFMAMEVMGNALLNKEKVWVEFEEVRPYLRNAVLRLLKNEIKVYIYNFPLCHIDEDLWQFAVKSISDHKVRYLNDCDGCSVKNRCGGFFFSTGSMKGIKAIRIN